MVEVRTIAVMGATGQVISLARQFQKLTAYPGRQGRGVVDALMFTKGDIEYHVRPLTRSLTSKIAQRFEYDYPQLTLVQWKESDVDSLQKCFERCYGAFVNTGVLFPYEASVKDWTRAELALGDRVRQAAEVMSLSLSHISSQ